LLNLSILYRGPLEVCNYDCGYCTLAKNQSLVDLSRDEAALNRFMKWAEEHHDIRLSVFFTPAGEALIHPWYQRTLERLTRLPSVVKIAAQTNLSCSLDWVQDCNVAKLALWCTYHPAFVERDAFLKQCRRLDSLKIRYSTGMVGLKEHVQAAEELRSLLPPHIYLWINAFKHENDYYTEQLANRYTAIDPLFPFSLQAHASFQRSCRTGEAVIAVDGEGTIHRCHFVAEPLGNIYQSGWEKSLRPRACPNTECRCHIGYVHLVHLGLREIFGEGLLERIPA
jgi:MoaA/NifB/PqqE/SkfB family radical SAM enzyme